ncbi:MAG: histidine kinase, partial [Anaerolineaceae bacterium]|nr:histidine kinase [Anaerolineaceae bacterium]
MKEDIKRPISLRSVMIIMVIFCWLIPIAAVSVIFGSLLTRSYADSQQSAIETTVRNAIRELDIRLNAAIEDSKDVSYDGIVRSSYRKFQLDQDPAELYGSVNEYLSQRFSRDEKYKAVFISFREGVNIGSYVISPGFSEYSTLRNYRGNTEPLIMEKMAQEDTAIRFFVFNNELYIARNLLDGKFIPYASVVMLCNEQILFSSFEDLPRGVVIEIGIDGESLAFGDAPEPESDHNFMEFSSEISGHTVSVTSAFRKFHVWKEVPSLKYGILCAVFLGLPMLLTAAVFFHRQISKPTQNLLEGSEHVIAGERGYNIGEIPGNLEFRQLTERFNTLSAELKNQFEQLYQEQQALQRAKIKTLQSQINPHFLNNTLEVINWEARMADNEKVSAMIEALSTMLEAPLDRDGKGMIPLSQEIRYVDAYLYIIQERLGDRF